MQELEIKKPLYANYICIREEHLLSSPQMKVTIPKGSAIIDTHEWIKNGKLMEKVFLRPDEPMRLWCNHLLTEPNDDEAQLTLF